jgi:putative acetyltransferase
MIRPLDPADAESVAAISRRARMGAIAHFPDLHTAAEDVAFYRGEINAKSGWVWVDEPGRIVGFVIWRDPFIDHLYVDPGRQRSGIGAALLERVAVEMDGPEIRLWTFQANARAVAFYGRNGFRILDATDGSGNEERLPDYLLVRP